MSIAPLPFDHPSRIHASSHASAHPSSLHSSSASTSSAATDRRMGAWADVAPSERSANSHRPKNAVRFVRAQRVGSRLVMVDGDSSSNRSFDDGKTSIDSRSIGEAVNMPTASVEALFAITDQNTLDAPARMHPWFLSFDVDQSEERYRAIFCRKYWFTFFYMTISESLMALITLFVSLIKLLQGAMGELGYFILMCQFLIFCTSLSPIVQYLITHNRSGTYEYATTYKYLIFIILVNVNSFLEHSVDLNGIMILYTFMYHVFLRNTFQKMYRINIVGIVVHALVEIWIPDVTVGIRNIIIMTISQLMILNVHHFVERLDRRVFLSGDAINRCVEQSKEEIERINQVVLALYPRIVANAYCNNQAQGITYSGAHTSCIGMKFNILHSDVKAMSVSDYNTKAGTLLNAIDNVMNRLDKIGSFGNYYLATQGLFENPYEENAKRVARLIFGLSSSARYEKICQSYKVSIRVHSGRVMGAIIGKAQRFEVFGEAIRDLERMHNSFPEETILVSEDFQAIVRDSFNFHCVGEQGGKKFYRILGPVVKSNFSSSTGADKDQANTQTQNTANEAQASQVLIASHKTHNLEVQSAVMQDLSGRPTPIATQYTEVAAVPTQERRRASSSIVDRQNRQLERNTALPKVNQQEYKQSPFTSEKKNPYLEDEYEIIDNAKRIQERLASDEENLRQVDKAEFSKAYTSVQMCGLFACFIVWSFFEWNSTYERVSFTAWETLSVSIILRAFIFTPIMVGLLFAHYLTDPEAASWDEIEARAQRIPEVFHVVYGVFIICYFLSLDNNAMIVYSIPQIWGFIFESYIWMIFCGVCPLMDSKVFRILCLMWVSYVTFFVSMYFPYLEINMFEALLFVIIYVLGTIIGLIFGNGVKNDVRADEIHKQKLELQERLDLEETRERLTRKLKSILPEDQYNLMRDGQSMSMTDAGVIVLMVIEIPFEIVSRDVSAEDAIHMMEEIYRAISKQVKVYHLDIVKTLGNLILVHGRSEPSVIEPIRNCINLATMIHGFGIGGDASLFKIGIAIGKCYGGILSRSRAAYDYFGEAASKANEARMHCKPGMICVAKEIYQRGTDLPGFNFTVQKGDDDSLDVYVEADDNPWMTTTEAYGWNPKHDVDDITLEECRKDAPFKALSLLKKKTARQSVAYKRPSRMSSIVSVTSEF